MTNRKQVIKSSGLALIMLLALMLIFLAETHMIQGKAQVVPTPTPSPSPTPTIAPTATPKPTATPTPTASSAPTLSNGYVSPTSGTTSTNFSYYITYVDPSGTNPSSTIVVIDNSPHSMSLYTGTASNGIYQYSTALSVTSHTYYFMFTSGLSGQTALFGLPTQFSGPTMTGATPSPTPVPTPGSAALSGGTVNPPKGFTYDTYTFFVNYNDPRGSNASSPYVYIDNVRYLMSLYSGSASNGLYSYGTNSLLAGNHTFYFNFISGSSGQNVTLGLPTQIIGPIVTAITPAPTQAPTPTPTSSPTPEPSQTPIPTIQPTNPPITPNSPSAPSPSPSPSQTPKLQPTPTQPLIPLPTATPSINPNEAYTNSKNYPLWPIAAAAIIGITLIVFLIISRKKSTDPNDEIEF